LRKYYLRYLGALESVIRVVAGTGESGGNKMGVVCPLLLQTWATPLAEQYAIEN
jgi:hypothetical protein